MDQADSISCPFCGYNAEGEYQIMLHMESKHPEGDESPFIVKDDAASVAALIEYDSSSNEDYVLCPVDGCGEALMLAELESHVEMHEEEQDTGNSEVLSSRSPKRLKLDPEIKNSFSSKLSYALRNIGDPDDERPVSDVSSPDRNASVKDAWRKVLKMPESSSSKVASANMIDGPKPVRRRLGKSELGPHHAEKQMPEWLVKVLQKDGDYQLIDIRDGDGKLRRIRFCPNQAAGIIPIIEQLVYQDDQVAYAYFCHPATKHVSKLRREGGFCGYRNIQMMCSYIIRAESQGHEIFNGKIPTIFQIQDYIEHAWDMGINDSGRIETGGIRGTRKYIGTPDAQAMFCSLGIACDAQGMKTRRNQGPAYEFLFNAVESYFIDGCTDYDHKVRCTDLPSVYFQHPGHSMTIIGFEKRKDGSKNLIVFDPMFHDATNITRFIGQSFKHSNPSDLLKAYRRGVKYLKKYDSFELLKLTPPPNPKKKNVDNTNTPMPKQR
ncbi:uncharacterized protein L3040_008583 [Drepanopeziza brunnea f. sp. 'multigermtubi']|uniref:uncharacterized protein n=1 Tax=Drepanopeziza brunnea f. sp. 'multigermtubi' TaxID=698441 RepID=UPI0023A01932|nr:hypothetical protein L3040_008583 [Drepanopeziza brunnea f. sp. 'multigermtubi']